MKPASKKINEGANIVLSFSYTCYQIAGGRKITNGRNRKAQQAQAYASAFLDTFLLAALPESKQFNIRPLHKPVYFIHEEPPMILGRVIGTIVSTSKDENLEGFKLMIVQHVDLDMENMTAYTVAADGIGAGVGEIVLVVSGSSARMGTRTKNRPVDASVLAIVDLVEIEGKIVYRKETAESGT